MQLWCRTEEKEKQVLTWYWSLQWLLVNFCGSALSFLFYHAIATCCSTLIGWIDENFLDYQNKVAGRQSSVRLNILFTWPYFFYIFKKKNLFSCFGNQFSSFTFQDSFVLTESFATDPSLVPDHWPSWMKFMLTVWHNIPILAHPSWI